MVKKRRKLEYEEPVTKVELTNQLGGLPGRQLRSRLERTGHPAEHIRSLALIEQAVGFLAESRQVSINEARHALIHDAADRGLTMRAAAERIIQLKD